MRIFCIISFLGFPCTFAYDNLSYKKVASQSHTSAGVNRDASNAVDGNTSSCMRTYDIGRNSLYKTVWWKVDLGRVYHIYNINIVFYDFMNVEYEKRQRGRFAGFSLYVSDADASNTSDIKDSNLCYKDGPDLPPLNLTTTCFEYGRYVIFYNERLDYVSYPPDYERYNVYTDLCEVIVLGCESGVYGSYCSIPCPNNCKENKCHIQNGTCFVCQPGWSGRFCNIKCEEGLYGINCSQRCPGHCKDGTICNHVTGRCDGGCADGMTGYMCDKECDNGTYGHNCASRCSGRCKNDAPCNKQTGHCDKGCKAGFADHDCNRECLSGYFGIDCRDQCSGHCRNNYPCHHVSGACSNGCLDGYKGTQCDDSCSEGYYGRNCSKVCSFTCQTCRNTDGLCTCKAGWMGPYCITASQQNVPKDNNDIASTPWIVAFSIVLVISIILGISTIQLWRSSLKRNLNAGCVESERKSVSGETQTGFSDGALHYQVLSVSKEHNTYQTLTLE